MQLNTKLTDFIIYKQTCLLHILTESDNQRRLTLKPFQPNSFSITHIAIPFSLLQYLSIHSFCSVVVLLKCFFTIWRVVISLCLNLTKICDTVPLEQVQDNITKRLIMYLYILGLYGRQQVSATAVCYLGSLPLEVKALDSFAQKPMRKALENVNCNKAIYTLLFK